MAFRHAGHSSGSTFRRTAPSICRARFAAVKSVPWVPSANAPTPCVAFGMFARLCGPSTTIGAVDPAGIGW